MIPAKYMILGLYLISRGRFKQAQDMMPVDVDAFCCRLPLMIKKSMLSVNAYQPSFPLSMNRDCPKALLKVQKNSHPKHHSLYMVGFRWRLADHCKVCPSMPSSQDETVVQQGSHGNGDRGKF
jgi:hypothetical protein